MATEVGKAYVTLIPSAKGFASKMQAELGGDIARVGDQSGKEFGDKFTDESRKRVSGKGKKIFSGLAKAGGVAALAAGAVVGKLMGDSIAAAADMGETLSKAGAIFGEEAVPQLEKFAGTAATTMGQSKQQALDALSTFAIFGKAAGLAGKDLVGFSQDFTGLASDLASFHNAEPQEAIDAIGAALRGEAEPMRRFGVMLNDATLKAEAMALGLLKPVKNANKIQAANVAVTESQKKYNDTVAEYGKGSLEALKAEAALGTARDRLKKETEGTIGPLTQQQKTLAAQSAIMKQTKDAQGDFAKTSGGLANQQRSLKAQFEDVKVAIGQGLLPVATKLVTWAGTMMPTIKSLGSTLGDNFVPALKMVGAAAAEVFGFIRSNQTTFKVVAAAVAALTAVTLVHTAVMAFNLAGIKAWFLGTKVITAATKAWAAVQWLVTIAMNASPIGLIVLGIAALIAVIVLVVKKTDFFGKLWDKVWGGIKTAFWAVFGFIQKHWPVILAILTGPIGLAVLAIVKNWARIKAGAAALVGWFKTLPGKIWGALQGVGSKIKQVFVAAWRLARAAVVAGATAVVNYVRSFPRNLLRGLANLGRNLKALFVGAWRLVDGVMDSARTKIINAITAIPGKLRGLVSKFASAGRALIGGLLNGLSQAGGFVSDLVGNVWSGIQGFINTQLLDRLDAAISFKVDWPGPGSFSFNPDIPRLAGGGRATSGTLAVIGEGREPETVLPDSMLGDLLGRAAGAGAVGHLTITNWREGTGYFRLVAEESLAADHRFRRDVRGMNA